MKAIKLKTSGEISVVELPKRSKGCKSMADALGCDLIDIKDCSKSTLDGYCLVFDDEYLLTHREPFINVLGSYLYGVAEHGQLLFGDVLIMKNEWVMVEGVKELDTVGLNDDEIEHIHDYLGDHFVEALYHVKKLIDKLNDIKKMREKK